MAKKKSRFWKNPEVKWRLSCIQGKEESEGGWRAATDVGRSPENSGFLLDWYEMMLENQAGAKQSSVLQAMLRMWSLSKQ